MQPEFTSGLPMIQEVRLTNLPPPFASFVFVYSRGEEPCAQDRQFRYCVKNEAMT